MFATKAAVWLAAKWRPELIDHHGLFHHDAFEEMRRGGACGGEGVMMALLAALRYGELFDLSDLARLDERNRHLALRAIECAAGTGPLAEINEFEISAVPEQAWLE